MSVLLCWLALLLGDSRAFSVEVELEGPLHGVEFDLGAAGSTRVLALLLEGERRVVDVPLPLSLPFGTANTPVPALEPVVRGKGTARVLGWADDAALATLPAGLARRPRPPAPTQAPPPKVAPLLVSLALILVAWRGPKRAGPILALVASPALGWWIARDTPALEARTVIEVDLDSDAAVRVSAHGASVTWGSRARLEVEPSGASVELILDLTGVEPRRTARVVHAGTLVLLEPFALSTGQSLDRRLGVELANVWTRGPGGTWTGTGNPPGWLVAGLPQGVAIQVGRTTGGEWFRASGELTR